MFFRDFLCKCPCSHSEPQPIHASPGGPPIPLGRSLDLLWALWDQLRHWPGPTHTCTCPQSPLMLRLAQSHLWEHSLSIQIFHRCRIYQVDHGDLICSLCSCTGRFPFPFFSLTAPGAQLWFWPHLCMCTILRPLLPAQARWSKSSGWLGHTYSLSLGRGNAATVGVYGNCLWGRRQADSFNSLGHAHSSGSPSQCRRGRSWHVGVVIAPSFAHHSTIVPHSLGRPCFL